MTKFLILEGPEHSALHGWRHYRIVSKYHDQSCISQPGGLSAWLSILEPCKFYPAGTWELEATAVKQPFAFAVARPEIMAEVGR